MKKTLFLVAALCTAVAQAETTYTYDGAKWNDTPQYALQDDTTFNVVSGTANLTAQSISGTSNLTKDGAGTLETRVNDHSGNPTSNNFLGNVTVNAGTLAIEAKTQPTAAIGVGYDSVITVAKDAYLQFIGETGIQMPSGNDSWSDVNRAIGIRNSQAGETGMNAYADEVGNSYITNATITADSIVATGEGQGKVVAYSVSLTDKRDNPTGSIKNVDVYADRMTFTGSTTVSGATIHTTSQIAQTTFGLTAPPSVKVSDGSKIIFDTETYKEAAEAGRIDPNYEWRTAALMNTAVDKTSYINAGDKDGKLMAKDDMMYIQLKKGNELHIASSGKEGGVATQYFRDGAGNIVTTIEGLQEVEDVYVTDQLSGCALQVGSDLMVTLDDTMLPDPMKHETFTFTVVLQGLDSTAVLAATQGDFESGTFYDMDDSSPVQLAIGAYKDAPWYQMDTTIQLAAFSGDEASWKGKGPATVFKFTVTGLVIPEPATATLSLLALAGLAARRRRH